MRRVLKQFSMRGIQKLLRQILKKYFIYEIYKKKKFYIVSIQFIRDVSIEKFRLGIFRWKHRLQKCYEMDGNYVEK